MSNKIYGLDNNAGFSGATTFQEKMKINHKMNNFAALKKVANNMMREQNNRITKIVDDLKSTESHESSITIEDKGHHLFTLYFNIQREIQFLDEYTNSINNINKKNPEKQKLSKTLFDNRQEIEDKLISMREKVKESIDTLVLSTVKPVMLVGQGYIEMSVDMPRMMSNLAKNPNLMHQDIWQDVLNARIADKTVIDDSFNVFNNWVEQCEINNDTEGLGLVKAHRDSILLQQTKFDKIGLTNFVRQGLMAEFICKAEIMQEAKSKLQDMQKMVTIFEENIAKYNANPQDFDANYNFEQDVKEYNVFPHWNSKFLAPNTNRENAQFVDSFMYDMDRFFKLKDSRLFNEEEQSKVDQVVEMGSKLSAQLAKSRAVETAFLSKVAELKSQIPTESTIKINENIDSSTHSIELEKESESTPSLESKSQLDEFSIMLDKIIAMKEQRGHLITKLSLELDNSSGQDFSTLLPSFNELFKFNVQYETFTKSYSEYVDSLSSEDDIVEDASEEEEKIGDAFIDNLHSQRKEMKKINERYGSRLFDEERNLTKDKNIDSIVQLKSLTTEFIAQKYVQDDENLIGKYTRLTNRLDKFLPKSKADTANIDTANIDTLRNSINNKAFDTVESSMTTNPQTEVMNLPITPIEMNG